MVKYHSKLQKYKLGQKDSIMLENDPNSKIITSKLLTNPVHEASNIMKTI